MRESWEELKVVWHVWTKDMGPSRWSTVAGLMFFCLFGGLSSVVEGAQYVADVGLLIALLTTLFRQHASGRWW